MACLLQSKLGQRLDPPGEIALPQFKLLWRWFYGFVAAINSCSLLRVAWDRRLIAGCVDRKGAEALARPREGNVCFRFSKELNTVANFALVASVHSAGGVLHVPIVVRPQNADRFLVTAKVPVAGQEGRHEFVTLTGYFDKVSDAFRTLLKGRKIGAPLVIDCACGVGSLGVAPLVESLKDVVEIQLRNTWSAEIHDKPSTTWWNSTCELFWAVGEIEKTPIFHRL